MIPSYPLRVIVFISGWVSLIVDALAFFCLYYPRLRLFSSPPIVLVAAPRDYISG